MSDQSYELSAGERFDLAVAVREAMYDKVAAEDRGSLMNVFRIDNDEQDSWTDTFINADTVRLIALSTYLGVPVPDFPKPVQEVDEKPFSTDAYSELVAAETALRDVIRLAIPAWQLDLDELELQKLKDKQTEEGKKRDGIAVSQDLLDYTEIYLIQKLIEKNWNVVKPVLDDRKRTDVYLSIIIDVRNTIGHSRPVVPAEKLLLAGAAGQIRNQLAGYRSSVDGAASHYSSIDSARDSFGNDGHLLSTSPYTVLPTARRLEVGEQVSFELQATDPRGRALTWNMYVSTNPVAGSYARLNSRATVDGDRATVAWNVSESDVGESTELIFRLTNSSQYQRSTTHDDIRIFYYKVNPPLD